MDSAANSSVVIPLLCPPEAFGIVEKGVYRSKFFQPTNFSFIGSLKLKTVVNVSEDLFPRSTYAFVVDNNINFINLGGQHAAGERVTVELVKEALQIILDTSHHPIMVTCNSKGTHITGTVIGCLRRLQKWSLTSIVDEYRMLGGRVNTRHGSQHFIELFDEDIVTLPQQTVLPDWFTEPVAMLKEEKLEESALRSSGCLSNGGVRTDTEVRIVGGSEVEGGEGGDKSGNPEEDNKETVIERMPAYRQYFFAQHCPLVSERAKFSEKKSICDDDED